MYLRLIVNHYNLNARNNTEIRKTISHLHLTNSKSNGKNHDDNINIYKIQP
jgi:hypothetical protein